MTDNENRPDVSIVFTHWNVRDMLRNCLHSVKEKTLGLTYEIIIVDDGSTDGSVEMIRSEFPEVTLIANETNIGVAKSYNKGVARARGRFVQMLNTDMVLVNNAVKLLLDFLTAHPEAGACAGKLRNTDMSPQLSYGSFPGVLQAFSEAFALRHILPFIRWPQAGVCPDDSITEPLEAEYLSGADMLIRKEVIDKIGFFDDRYTSYCEETDFCYRIRHETPWRLFYVPTAEIIHFGGQSFSKVPEYRLRLMYSGYNKFLTKHHGWVYSLITRSLYAAQWGRRWLAARLACLLSPSDDLRSRVTEASWHVRYALFPQEGRVS
ncbi:MAG TPA: glycosyltransferase family 2 protein [Bacteroidota bacterium]|nr:glycosyltransferase family 2 protein [Bacteroidota bacterium]